LRSQPPNARTLTYEQARNVFNDRITTVRVDTASFEGKPVDVESLDGLVDIAIDSDRRVLEDRSTGTYYCRIDNQMYRYEPPPEPTEGPLSALGQQRGSAGSRPSDEWQEKTDSKAVANGRIITDEETDSKTTEREGSGGEKIDGKANDDETSNRT
jgi:hypothetical protein